MSSLRTGYRRAKSVPTILQMEAVECGAACLAMVLAAFGRFEALDNVRDSCGVSRDGVSAADLIQAARQRGLDAQAFSREVDGLAQLPLPQILFWDFNHFVVLEKIIRGGFIINDPAFGRRTVPKAEFGRRFTGITLSFRAAPDFRPTARPKSTARRLAGLLRGSAGMFATIILSSMAMVAVSIVVPGLTQIFVDDYLVQGRKDWLFPLLAALILSGLLNSLLTAVHNRGLLLLQTKITLGVSAMFVWRLFRLPYEFFVRRSTVEVSSRPQLATQLAGIASGPLADVATNFLTMAGYLGVMLMFSHWLTLVVVIFALFEFLCLRLVRRSIEERAIHLQMATGQAHAVAVQGVALLGQARVSGGDGMLFDRMVEAQIKLINSEQDNGRVLRLLAALPYFSSRATTLAVLGSGALLVMHTEMTLGALLGFMMLAGLFTAAVNALTGISSTMGQGAAALTRLGDAIDYDNSNKAAVATGQSATTLSGRIRLRNVCFAYQNSVPLLKGLSLDVEAGELIGIVGASGSGKSTLARLLSGVMKPSSGELCFETQPGHWLEDQIGVGYVEQEIFMPAGSLRAALTLWHDATSDSTILRALEDAEIADVVAERPGGINGQIGEGGGGFSGGERQRLALARALILRPDILVLDEATSALDEATEFRVLRNLRRRGSTLILLTNRASALVQMDRVYGLHDGELLPVDMEDVREAVTEGVR